MKKSIAERLNKTIKLKTEVHKADWLERHSKELEEDIKPDPSEKKSPRVPRSVREKGKLDAVKSIATELVEKRHMIYSFDAGLEDEGTTLSALSVILNLALDDGLIKNYHFEKQTIKHLIPLNFGQNAGKTDGRVVKVTLTYDDDITGIMYYIKTTLKVEEPDKIVLTSHQDTNFPYHSTLNQFFTPALFRAYHDLGHHSAKELLLVKEGKLDYNRPASKQHDGNTVLADSL